ncbi:MAG: type II toxin-antitoxin system RelE/ParE family toxin [Verrucomicrobia bacterium]|nr:type II toxin-antitoxin system RelE/ParE family toxin [Verrucomicrobiota bacterium]
MASYRVEFRGSAERELRRIDPLMVPRIMEAIRGLAEEPRPSGTRKLAGSEQTFRIRVGDYRVVYTVDDEARMVSIDRVRHRREAYR